MFEHLFWYHLSNWQFLLMFLGIIFAFVTGKILDKKPKIKKGITLFFAVGVFVLDYFSYRWDWVIQEHSTWHYFGSWHHLFSFFEFIFLPFDIGFLLSWIKIPKKPQNLQIGEKQK